MNNSAIAHSARRLRLLVWVGIALIVGIYLLGRLGPQLGPVRVETHGDVAGREGRALIDLTLLMFVIALFRLSQMLGAVAEGPLFGPRVTKAFRGFAFWLFLATLVDVIAGPAVSLVNMARAGATRTALTFELRDLLMLLGALFLFLLARMLQQDRAIESELEEIV